EGSFLAGAMAALTTESDKLGFLGGLDIPLINRFGAGFEQGAKWINPDVTVTWAYSPDSSNPWGDLSGGKTVAQSMIDTGVDIIFAAAGGTGLGVFDAAKEATDAGSKTYAIGVDSNQDHLKKGIVLTSMLKRVDVAVKTQIDAVVDGTWKSGFQSLGLAEEGVGITDMEFTQAEANAQCGTQTRLEYVNSLSPGIIDGSIFINDSKPVVFNTTPHPCGTPPVSSSVEASTVTSVVTSVSVSVSETGGVPIATLPIIFAIFATVFILRKRK
ncbi:MAG: BMP family protein, partial [Candidatus Heimdallarchaeota archaeon]